MKVSLIEIAKKYYPKIEADWIKTKHSEKLEWRYFLNGIGRKNKGSYSSNGLRNLIISKKIEYAIIHSGLKNIVRAQKTLSVYLYHKDLCIRLSDHPKCKVDVSVKDIDYSFLVLLDTDEKEIASKLKELV